MHFLRSAQTKNSPSLTNLRLFNGPGSISANIGSNISLTVLLPAASIYGQSSRTMLLRNPTCSEFSMSTPCWARRTRAYADRLVELPPLLRPGRLLRRGVPRRPGMDRLRLLLEVDADGSSEESKFAFRRRRAERK